MIYHIDRDIPVAAEVEVLVVGGGPGEVCAATMAAALCLNLKCDPLEFDGKKLREALKSAGV